MDVMSFKKGEKMKTKFKKGDNVSYVSNIDGFGNKIKSYGTIVDTSSFLFFERSYKIKRTYGLLGVYCWISESDIILSKCEFKANINANTD